MPIIDKIVSPFKRLSCCFSKAPAQLPEGDGKLGGHHVHPTPHATQTTLLQKIGKVVSFVFKALVGVFLYWTNPSLFAIGFIAGVVLDEQVKQAATKIHNIWQTQPWLAMATIGIGAFLSLPVTLAAGSILWGANLGSQLSLRAQKAVIDADEKLEKPLADVSG